MRRPLLAACAALCLAACEREVVFPDGLGWGEPPVPPYTAAARLALTNNGDDTLAYVSIAPPDSLDQPRLLAQAPVGRSPIELEGPHHLAASPDGRYIYFNLSNYVTGGGGGPHGAHGSGSVPGYLVKLDARTNRPLAQVLVDRSPGDVILSADGKRLFVSHYDFARLQAQLTRNGPPEEGFSSVVIIDAETLRVLSSTSLCPTAHGEGLSPDGARLYVTCAHSDEVAVLDVRDPSLPQVVRKVKVGLQPGPHGAPRYAPYALTVHKGGDVWISNNESQDVYVLDPVSLTTTRVTGLGGLAMFGVFSEDGETYYVPSQGREDRLTAIDRRTKAARSLVLPRAACYNAHAAILVPGGIGLVCEGDHRQRKGALVLLSDEGAALRLRGSVETGIFPDGAIVLPPAPR